MRRKPSSPKARRTERAAAKPARSKTAPKPKPGAQSAASRVAPPPPTAAARPVPAAAFSPPAAPPVAARVSQAPSLAAPVSAVRAPTPLAPAGVAARPTPAAATIPSAAAPRTSQPSKPPAAEARRVNLSPPTRTVISDPRSSAPPVPATVQRAVPARAATPTAPPATARELPGARPVDAARSSGRPAEQWVRSRERFRPRRTAAQRLLHAGGLIIGLGLLAWIPMQFGPQTTVANTVDGADRPRLVGTLIGTRYLVEVRAAGRDPLYTVRLKRDGRVIVRDVPADDVYRLVPDLDVVTLHVGPDGELHGPLMMVNPTDTP